jgi:hypothetical protein
VIGLVASAAQALPAEPPLGGIVWSYVVPGALLVVAFLGTFLLYRRFASEEDQEGP